ncbi:phenylacetate-CoA oxygenase subunit PaaC [Rhodospirillaceae bacterium KN72]|uniref:Phenylacetate-CoA oxygenase subunit PaaC n=1 Tax=Pacificispira spongiicola TaxID=2729598 RepID=A0A7Y0DWG8_9PROT|nr:1,2-phenylacetyl-CoA epoxidase subunit PaaC [Pacificispira spongiicola]NMM42874.1 phenylacetate-CoA oxygenase subunit PaaC [Pacificispira spongiicola]
MTTETQQIDAQQIDRADLVEYLLRLGDNSMILGQRLCEWCGHGPVLEEDIALSNVALDLIGQARLIYTHAGEVEGKGQTEDDIAFLRDVFDWKNVHLVEQPNGDFADTMARQFMIDCYNVELFSALTKSTDDQLAAIAAKTLKEVTYHRRHSGEWVIRLGDGTDESHRRIQAAFDRHWIFVEELFESDDLDARITAAGIGPDPKSLRPAWDSMMDRVLSEATLTRPTADFPRSGGRKGEHSEYLGYILADMQFMQRAYPGMDW